MSSFGSDIQVTMELTARREAMRDELQRGKEDVRQWTSDIQSMKVQVPVTGKDELTAMVDKLIADIQSTRRIVIPIVGEAGGSGTGSVGNQVSAAGATPMAAAPLISAGGGGYGGSGVARSGLSAADRGQFDLLTQAAAGFEARGVPVPPNLLAELQQFQMKADAPRARAIAGAQADFADASRKFRIMNPAGPPGMEMSSGSAGMEAALMAENVSRAGRRAAFFADQEAAGMASAEAGIGLEADALYGESRAGIRERMSRGINAPSASRRNRTSYFERRIAFTVGLYGAQSMLSAETQYGESQILGAGDPAALAQSELAYRKGIGGFPIIGGVAEFATDPFGFQEAGARMQIDGAKGQEQAYRTMFGTREFATQFRMSADIAAQGSSYLREKMSLDLEQRQRQEQIQEHRREYGESVMTLKRQRLQEAEAEYRVSDMAESPWEHGPAAERLYSRSNNAAFLARQQLGKADSLRDEMLSAAATEYKGKLADIDLKRSVDIQSIRLGERVAGLESQLRPDLAAMEEMRGKHLIEESAERDSVRRRAMEGRNRAEERVKQDEIDRAKGYQIDVTRERVFETQESGEFAVMRGQGLNRQAGNRQYEDQLQREVRLLRDRATASRDAAEATNLLAEAKAKEAAIPQMMGGRLAEQRAEDFMTAQGMQIQIDALGVGTSGYAQSRSSTLGQAALASFAYRRAGLGGLADMAEQRGAAEMNALDFRHRIAVQAVEDRAAETRLLNRHMPHMAGARAMLDEERQSLAANVGDPEMQGAIRREFAERAQHMRFELDHPTPHMSSMRNIYEGVLLASVSGRPGVGQADLRGARDILGDITRGANTPGAIGNGVSGSPASKGGSDPVLAEIKNLMQKFWASGQRIAILPNTVQ